MADSADNIQTYRQMLKLDRRSRVFAALAEQLCAAGEWKEAAEVCKKGLLFHPDHLRSRVLLGWALMEMGETSQSERILLNVVEDIRKSAISFKLLSEFAAISGNTQIAGEYARIYEAFQPPGPDQGGVASPLELGHPEPACPPKKEVSEWDNFKAEAIEELQDTVSQEISSHLTPVIGPASKIGLEDILTHLVQRIDGRLIHNAVPAAILSEDDKNMLKEKIVAVLGA
ncbi:MAG: tetratricopeptide repeat protein [Syntrophobacteraceae bacterium]